MNKTTDNGQRTMDNGLRTTDNGLRTTDNGVQKMDFESRFVSCSVTPLRFDDAKCIGCNRCAAVCQVDILVPSSEKGKHPVVLYPGECYYCGSCVMACSHDAIKLVHPLMNQTKFVEV